MSPIDVAGMARTGMLRLVFSVATLVTSAEVHAAEQAPFVVTCQRENVMVKNWDGPLTVTYAGGPSGELRVASEHVTFAVPATVSERSGIVDGVAVAATGISGAAETLSVMPDVEALQACARQSVPQDFKDDPDMLAMALMGCVGTTAAGASPVPVTASITVGLISTAEAKGPDIVVEISRRYSGAQQAVIETFPGNCSMATN